MLELSPLTSPDGLTIRRELRPGDIQSIVDLHARIYTAEHGMGRGFVADVADALSEASEHGWPGSGGVRIVEAGRELAGSTAWTDEGDHAKVRWVLLDARLRGKGLGRALLEETLEEIDAAGYEIVALTTFSELRTAAHLYRSLGFVLVESKPHVSWGPTVELQRYERHS